jgi:hypothetical protein
MSSTMNIEMPVEIIAEVLRSDVVAPTTEVAVSKAKTLPEKFKKMVIFEYWFINKMIESNTVIGMEGLVERSNLSIEDQLAFYTEFEEDYKEETKKYKTMLKDIKKPKKEKREVKPKRTMKVVYPGETDAVETENIVDQLTTCALKVDEKKEKKEKVVKEKVVKEKVVKEKVVKEKVVKEKVVKEKVVKEKKGKVAVEAVAEVAVEAVAEVAVEAVAEVAVEAVAEVAVEAVAEVAVEAVAEVAVEAVAEVAVEAVAEVAVEAVAEVAVTKKTKTIKETKPKETKPKETKPKETKPKETKPKETKPKETKPKETKPKETKANTAIVVSNELIKEDVSSPAKNDVEIDVRYIEDSPYELEDVVETREFMIDGKLYLKCSEDGAIYDCETQEFVGMYNEETTSIDK